MIFTKSTFSKKVQKIIDFGSIFGGQSDENSIKNRIRKYVFFIIEFLAFFHDFGSILGGPGDPGPSKKSQKIDQDAQKLDFGACLGHVCF